MTDYSGLKVAELKDVLKAKGLSVSGTKPELLARLKEADEAEAEAKVDDSAAEKVEQVQEPANTTESSEKTEEATTKPTEESTGDADAKPAESADAPSDVGPAEEQEPVATGPTAEEVIAELEKRIKRNERFGNEDQNEDLQQQIARIKKFGLPAKADKVLKPKVNNARVNKHSKAKKATNGSNSANPAKAAAPKIVVDEETLKKRQAKFGVA